MKIILTAAEWCEIKDALNSAKSLLAEAGQLLDRQDFTEMVHQWHEQACKIGDLDRDFHDDFAAQTFRNPKMDKLIYCPRCGAVMDEKSAPKATVFVAPGTPPEIAEKLIQQAIENAKDGEPKFIDVCHFPGN